MTEIAIDIYGYRQRYQYSECAYMSMCVCVVHRLKPIREEAHLLSCIQ